MNSEVELVPGCVTGDVTSSGLAGICQQSHVSVTSRNTTPMVTPVVSELSVPVYNNVAIASIIPTNPLFPPRLRPQRPYHVGEDITEVGRGTRFIRVEDRDDIYYWITCRMDNTGVEFSMRVGRDLVIDPNPQDIAIMTCSSREFDAAVVGTSF